MEISLSTVDISKMLGHIQPKNLNATSVMTTCHVLGCPSPSPAQHLAYLINSLAGDDLDLGHGNCKIIVSWLKIDDLCSCA